MKSTQHISTQHHSACTRAVALGAAGCLLAGLVTACGGSDGSGGSGKVTTLTEMDYDTAPPQSKQLPKMLNACGKKAGVTIKRQALPRDQLMPKLLQGASAHQLPDLTLIDNPNLQQVAQTGALVPLKQAGLSTDGFYPSIVSAGQYQGKLYGIAPGVNGLALFYNKDKLAKANVKPPKTWAQLKSAAAKLTYGSTYGLGFSAVGNEEGVFQFEPFFFTAGGKLNKLDSAQGVKALQLWTDLVHDGSASKSVVNWTQADVNDQFVAGHLAMMINGSWQLAVLNKHKKLHYGVIPLPTPQAGGKPVTPLGGEVWAVAKSGGARQAKAIQVLKCMLSDKNTLSWSKLNAYVPSKQSAAAKLAKQKPLMSTFVTETATAKARTQVLGTKYPDVSTALADAIQSAITGSKSPQQALQQAQQQAGS